MSRGPGMQELTIQVHVQQTKQELSVRHPLPSTELRATGRHCYRIQRSGSFTFAVQYMRKKRVVNEAHCVGNNGSYLRCVGKQDSRESNQPISLETVSSLGKRTVFMLHFPTPQGNKIKQPL